MATEKQIAANQRNAQKSTGPKTCEGKARSRRNALKHGLTAETVIHGLEDAKEYKAFESATLADFEPTTTIERALVLRLASLLWRLKRTAAIETGLLQSQSNIIEALLESDHAESGLISSDPIAVFRKLLVIPYQNGSARNPDPSMPAKGLQTNAIPLPPKIAQAFLRLSGPNDYSFELALRYETSLSRQLVQTSMCIAQIRQLTQHSRLNQYIGH